MIGRRAVAVAGYLFAIYLIAGCAVIKGASDLKHHDPANWHGRLAVSVEADPVTGQVQKQSFSAGFELQGNAQQGDLLFFTPLGSTAAAIHWTPIKAVLLARGETREFEDLSHLISDLLGINVPVAALFAWLDGQSADVDGWQVDLSQQHMGKIQAHRMMPAPAAELRVILED